MAFYGCPLGYISLGNKVKTIGGAIVSSGFARPMFVSCSATTPPSLDSYAFANSVSSIMVPRGSVDAYKNADGWCDYADIIVGN